MLANVSMVTKIQLGLTGGHISQLHGLRVSCSAECRSLNGSINPWQARTWRLRKQPSDQFNIGLKNLMLHAIRDNQIGKSPIQQERLPLFARRLHTDDLENYLESRRVIQGVVLKEYSASAAVMVCSNVSRGRR